MCSRGCFRGRLRVDWLVERSRVDWLGCRNIGGSFGEWCHLPGLFFMLMLMLLWLIV